jgi:phosphoglycerate dehydrogenase-like enzyme
MMKVLLLIHHRLDLWQVPTWFVTRLKAEFPQIEVVHLNSYDSAGEHLRDAEILFTISLRPQQFAVARQLRWIHAASAAVHQLLFPEIVQSDVVITNSREVHGPVVAEHVIALVFALARKIPQAAIMQRNRVWGQATIWNEGPRPREISGATLGLIGVGSIGRDVAKKASSLGMRVIAAREHVEKETPEGIVEVFASSQLDDFLSQADYVVLAAPLTPATQGLMNAARFAAMKADSYLINVGRGPQVEEAALVDALRKKRIAGAALDVFEREPLPPESPLWGLNNLLITPHTAGLTEKLWQRHYERFSENLRRYLAHQPLLFVVDKDKGY